MSNNSLDSGGGIIFVIILLFVVGFCCCRGCMADPQDAISHVETMGFTDVQVLDHSYLLVAFRGCGSDAAMFKIKAVNPAKKVVPLTVCVGWPFKGTTIRGN